MLSVTRDSDVKSFVLPLFGGFQHEMAACFCIFLMLSLFLLVERSLCLCVHQKNCSVDINIRKFGFLNDDGCLEFCSVLISITISTSVVDQSTYGIKLSNYHSSWFCSVLPKIYTVIASLRAEATWIPLGSLSSPYRVACRGFLRSTWCVWGSGLCSKMYVKEPSYNTESLCS